MNTPTGAPADPRHGSGQQRADTTTSEVVVSAGTAVAVTEGKRAAACRAGQLAGERSFMAIPLSLDTIDGPPTPKPRMTGDAREGAPPLRPIEQGGQTVTRSRSYQYASAGSALSTSITGSRS